MSELEMYKNIKENKKSYNLKGENTVVPLCYLSLILEIFEFTHTSSSENNCSQLLYVKST